MVAGIYRHTGLTGCVNIHLNGVYVASVKLDYTPRTGDEITLAPDSDNFMVSDLTLNSSGQSSGWSVRAEGVEHTGCWASSGRASSASRTESWRPTPSACRSASAGSAARIPRTPKGIGLKFGNGVTIEDCYFSSLDKGIVTYAQTCLISRPIIELCHTGIETHGTTSIVTPW